MPTRLLVLALVPASAWSPSPHGAMATRSTPLRTPQARLSAQSPDGLLRARLALVGTSVLWGTYPTCLKLIYAADGAPLTPIAITAMRFVIMAGVAQIVLVREEASSSTDSDTLQTPEDTPDVKELQSMAANSESGFMLAAAELGFWGCAGTQLNSLALQEIPAIRATLLLASVNVLTPSLQALFGTAAQRHIAPQTWIACILALGCTVLAVGAPSESVGSASSPALLSAADALVLGAAVAYAMAKVRLGSFVQRYPAKRLAAGRLQSQALISIAILGGAAIGSGGGLEADGVLAWAAQLSPTQLMLLAASALLPGALCEPCHRTLTPT